MAKKEKLKDVPVEDLEKEISAEEKHEVVAKPLVEEKPKPPAAVKVGTLLERRAIRQAAEKQKLLKGEI